MYRYATIEQQRFVGAPEIGPKMSRNARIVLPRLSKKLAMTLPGPNRRRRTPGVGFWLWVPCSQYSWVQYRLTTATAGQPSLSVSTVSLCKWRVASDPVFSFCASGAGTTKGRRQAGADPACRLMQPFAQERERYGERPVELDQPRVTTGAGALPFPSGALPTHPLTPMAKTIEQIAIRNFFMEPPSINKPETFVLPAIRPMVVFRQHIHRLRRHWGRRSARARAMKGCQRWDPVAAPYWLPSLLMGGWDGSAHASSMIAESTEGWGRVR